MLDQADFIARYDKEDMLGVVASQHEQLSYKFDADGLDKFGAISNIVLAGMGGSALAGEFVKAWLVDRLPVPFEVVRHYELPSYVGEDTLLIVSSYSGNTEETLAAVAQGQSSKAQIVVISNGGKLGELAAEEGLPYFQVPAGIQPRVAVGYGVRAISDLLEATGLVAGLVAELEAASKSVTEDVEIWKTAATDENPAKQLATAVLGHPIVMYGGEVTAVSALKWKINFNETSKNLAFYYLFPEFSHNEFMGWSREVPNDFKVIELISDLDNPHISKRFEITNRLLSGKMPAPIQVIAKGETKLQQMLWTQLLGDFVSVYLGVLNEIDPTPVPLIEKLKQELVK